MSRHYIKLFVDMLKGSGDLKIHPTLFCAYRLFGYLCVMSYDGKITEAEVRSLFRNFGLRNKAKVDAAFEYLRKSDIIMHNPPTYSPEKLELFTEALGLKLTKKDMELYKEIHEYIKDTQARGCLTVRYILDEWSGAAKERKGFRVVSAGLIHEPLLQGRSGKLLQLYVYLILAASFSSRYVFLQESFLTKFKVKLMPGETLTGIHSLADRLMISSKTVRSDLDKLVDTNLISVRTPPKGRSRIYSVVNYAEMQRFKNH